jgi:hypothetical protein
VRGERGRYRYGVCGSLVEFIDLRNGRETIHKLLPAVDQQQALAVLPSVSAR